MAPSFGLTIGKKIGFLAALGSLLAMASVAWLSSRLIERQNATQARALTSQTASLLSSTMDHELKSVAEKSRLLLATALSDFKNREEQLQLLEHGLGTDPLILAITLYSRSENNPAQWTPTIRLTRPEDDSDYVSEAELGDLDIQDPLEREGLDLSPARLANRLSIVRFGFPFEEATHPSLRRVLVDLHQEKFGALFSLRAPFFSVLLDRRHRVLLQSLPPHFAFGEKISTLPIFQEILTSDKKSGHLEFSEIPGGSPYYGAFQKTTQGKLWVISEASKKTLFEAWRVYFEDSLLWISLGLIVTFALIWGLSWVLFGAPLQRLAQAVELLEEGKTLTADSERFAPESYRDDEIGLLARALQALSIGFQNRKKEPIQREEIAIEPPKLAKPSQAAVLYCNIHGSGKLDELKKAMKKLIKTHRGSIASEKTPQALIAYWTLSEEKDLKQSVESALETSLALAALFKEKIDPNHQELSLTQGLHWGSRAAAEEASSRISDFAFSLGSEILITGAVLAHAPQWFSTEKIAPEDGDNPEIHELTGKAKTTEDIESFLDETLGEPRIA